MARRLSITARIRPCTIADLTQQCNGSGVLHGCTNFDGVAARGEMRYPSTIRNVMSHSTDNRRENKETALRTMAEATVDEMILTTVFRPPEYPETFLTTWTELQNEYLIEEANRKGPIEYRLTGAGWIAGLRLSESWKSPEFRMKAGKLSEALKGQFVRMPEPGE